MSINRLMPNLCESLGSLRCSLAVGDLTRRDAVLRFLSFSGPCVYSRGKHAGFQTHTLKTNYCSRADHEPVSTKHPSSACSFRTMKMTMRHFHMWHFYLYSFWLPGNHFPGGKKKSSCELHLCVYWGENEVMKVFLFCF